MDCAHIQEQLLCSDDLADAALPADVADHLQTCAACAGVLSRLRRLELEARELPTPDAGNSRDAFLESLAIEQSPARRWVIHPRLARPRAFAAAALILLAIGAAAWYLAAGGASRAQAADVTVDRLLEWNLDLAEADTPEQRARIYSSSAPALQVALNRNWMPADQKQLADKLMANGAWLSSNTDPLDGAERFDEVADLMLKQLQAATTAKQTKAAARIARQYQHVVNRGLGPQLKRAQSVPLDKPERKRRYERLMSRHAELERRMQQLLDRSPNATPKEMRKQLKADSNPERGLETEPSL
ncbi:MAG TPA: hypothetical protein VH370_05255 [Humisphaera sp.]|jgi:hypothetical protein|nr:hypothetical protein [Humisphaera sp.]